MSDRVSPGVVLQPDVLTAWQRGVNTLLEVIRPTIGPYGRKSVIDHQAEGRPLELLDDGGLIARRLIQLTDRDADMGAMFLRQMLWKLHEEVGDGTATAAILFQRVFDGGVRLVAAGYNPVLLRRYLGEGLSVILEQLEIQIQPVAGEAQLMHIARSLVADTELAHMLGEIFARISHYGRLEIRPGNRREMHWELVQGGYWDRKLFTAESGMEPAWLKLETANSGFLISDLDLEEPKQLVPALNMALTRHLPGLIILANHATEPVIHFVTNLRRSGKYEVCVVKTPGENALEQANYLSDIAALTGAKPVIGVAGDRLEAIREEHFGQADRGWVDRDYFGIVGGHGAPEKLEQHLLHLDALFESTEKPIERRQIQARIGSLLSHSAALWTGGIIESEVKWRQMTAERAGNALRMALRQGIVAGGGAALLACCPALVQKKEAAQVFEERAVYQILLRAMSGPCEQITANAGFDGQRAVQEALAAGPGAGFDVQARRVVSMSEAGIFDVAYPLQRGVSAAVESASLALSVEALVHRRNPVVSTEP